MNTPIFLSPPHLTGEEMTYLQDALASNWIAPLGPHVEAFEEELAVQLGVDHVLTTNSGTSAIHLGLISLGVGKSDEVICSTFTFCASANPIIYCGATPVFVDSEEGTWNMDPKLLEEAIQDRIKKTNKKPKAIVVVHTYGMPANMHGLIRVSRIYNIPILEDAAEALGSMYEGRQVGTFGEAGILSFNGNKIITTSCGGALFSSNRAITEKAKYFRQEAREPVAFYEHKSVGYNYRMSNLLAAVGRSQLKDLKQRVDQRRFIFEYYKKALSCLPVRFQDESQYSKSNRWLTVIEVTDDKYDVAAVGQALSTANIESRPAWKPMHLQPVYEACPVYTNGVSERIFGRGLCLPSGSNLTSDSLERVVTAINRYFND